MRDGHDLKLKSRRYFAREGRETVTNPVPKLRHLIPQGVDQSSIIEREVSDRNRDRYDKDEPANRHNAYLKKFHTHVTCVNPHNFAIALNAGVFEED